MKKPRNFDKWSPALRGAYHKGYDAGISGEPESACPYDDKRKNSGRLTWSRSFIAAWHDGWKHGRRDGTPIAWLVINADGAYSLFDDHEEACNYANWAHGPRPVHPLYRRFDA